MVKRWTARLMVAVTTGILIIGTLSAPAAASTCPAPGTGLPGSLNMIAAGAGMDLAMRVDAAQGNAGMDTSVSRSGC
jgi:hypothetical protein